MSNNYSNKYPPDLTDEQKSFSELTLLQKYDAVLEVLFDKSGESPTFDDVLNVLLAKKKKIHWGEVWDVINTMIQDGYVYRDLAQDGEQIYLVSFNGKLLQQTGGLEKKLESEKNKEILTKSQLSTAIDVGKWTKWNIALALLVSCCTLTVLAFNCNRETNRYHREIQQQAKDTPNLKEINKSVVEIKKELNQISLSLQDTSTKKIKIEKK